MSKAPPRKPRRSPAPGQMELPLAGEESPVPRAGAREMPEGWTTGYEPAAERGGPEAGASA